MIFLRKQMIKGLEADFSGAQIDALNTEDLVVGEEAYPNESITAIPKAIIGIKSDIKYEKRQNYISRQWTFILKN